LKTINIINKFYLELNMLSFKNWLNEAPETYYGDAGGYLDDRGTLSVPSKYDVEKHLGDGLYARRFKAKGSKPYMYRQEGNNDDNIHFVRGTRDNGVFVTQSTAKATYAGKHSDFYYDILRREKRIRSDKSQTAGGQRTWHDLAHDYPDVEVTHHDAETGEKIHLHTGKDWDNNFDQKRPTYFIAKLKKINK
jgi:hypothetical protein